MEVVKKFLGRPIMDAYENVIGQVVGLSTDTGNNVVSIGVELGTGEFAVYQSSRVTVRDDNLILLDPWKVEAEELKEELSLALKRIYALDELRKVGEIQKEIYDELHKQHEAKIAELAEHRKSLADKLSSEVKKLTAQIWELQIFLANNKIQHAAGEIDDGAYKIANNLIQKGLNRILREKKEMEALIDYLRKLDVETAAPALPQSTPQAPISKEFPSEKTKEAVVVHIEDEPQ
jgi:hypothetical protein